MALFVSGLYLEHVLTNFVSNFVLYFISGRSGFRLKMGKLWVYFFFFFFGCQRYFCDHIFAYVLNLTGIY